MVHAYDVQMNDRDTETIDLTLTLTRREAEMLTAGACEHFHRMKAVKEHEIYGALIVSPNVLAARDVWNKIESIVKVDEWATFPDKASTRPSGG